MLQNGSPTKEFQLQRGLKQGDPLSLFLFILEMEGLHVALEDVLAKNICTGVYIGRDNLKLSHLFYADDVIIFGE